MRSAPCTVRGLAPGQAETAQCLFVDGRELASIRYPTAEPLGEASENSGRRDHRDLLPDDLEDQGAEQVRSRQPLHPDVGIEIRMVIDHLGKHRIDRTQPGEPRTDLLRARRRHALQLCSSRQRTGRPEAGRRSRAGNYAPRQALI
jgi:hypothetical protein